MTTAMEYMEAVENLIEREERRMREGGAVRDIEEQRVALWLARKAYVNELRIIALGGELSDDVGSPWE
jgi:hypothetical protein